MIVRVGAARDAAGAVAVRAFIGLVLAAALIDIEKAAHLVPHLLHFGAEAHRADSGISVALLPAGCCAAPCRTDVVRLETGLMQRLDRFGSCLLRTEECHHRTRRSCHQSPFSLDL